MTKTYSKNIILHYPRLLTEQPVISNLIKMFDLTINISRARIGQDEEGLNYLREIGVTFKPISKVIRRIDSKCTHCGACIAVCPTGALVIEDRSLMEVQFIEKKCIACSLCIPACPYRAMEMHE